VNREFVRSFLRPYGLDEPAAPRFADAVESLASVRVAAPRRRGSLVGRVALGAIVAAGRSPRYREWLFDAEERNYEEWRRRKGEMRSRNRRAGLTAEQQAEAEREMRTHRANP
jgi:hypothetical protein